MIEKKEHFNNLLDIYGVLLTEHQKEICRLYYQEDLSLQEIAENFNVSRNAVFDNIKRVESSLEEYENKLGLLKKENNSKFLLIINFEKEEREKIDKLIKLNKFKEFKLFEDDKNYLSLKVTSNKCIEVERYLEEHFNKYNILVTKIDRETKK